MVLEPETASKRSDKHSALPEVKDWRGVSFFHDNTTKDENLMQTMLANLKRSKKQMILPDRRSG
jgi:hypothetical protein